MNKFDSNFIQVRELNKKKYVIFQYASGEWGVMIKEKYKVENLPRRFINDKLAREAVNGILVVEQRRIELADEHIEQTNLFG